MLLALGAICLWSTLAVLAVGLSAVPPFLLLGLALTGAGLAALPAWRQWRLPLPTLALGIYGLFGFHWLLFLALRRAPAVEANLINYLWPLFFILLAPLVLTEQRLTARHIGAGLLGFSGAALAITGGRVTFSTGHWDGYAMAFGSAFVWASYSLLTRRVPPFPTAAVGLFCLVSGALAIASHLLLEPRYTPSVVQWWLISALALGPMGIAFFFWDAAIKRGNAQAIGALSYLTPLGSTLLLLAAGHGRMTWSVALAAALIVGGALLGSLPPHRGRRQSSK